MPSSVLKPPFGHQGKDPSVDQEDAAGLGCRSQEQEGFPAVKALSSTSSLAPRVVPGRAMSELQDVVRKRLITAKEHTQRCPSSGRLPRDSMPSLPGGMALGDSYYLFQPWDVLRPHLGVQLYAGTSRVDSVRKKRSPNRLLPGWLGQLFAT